MNMLLIWIIQCKCFLEFIITLINWWHIDIVVCHNHKDIGIIWCLIYKITTDISCFYWMNEMREDLGDNEKLKGECQKGNAKFTTPHWRHVDSRYLWFVFISLRLHCKHSHSKNLSFLHLTIERVTVSFSHLCSCQFDIKSLSSIITSCSFHWTFTMSHLNVSSLLRTYIISLVLIDTYSTWNFVHISLHWAMREHYCRMEQTRHMQGKYQNYFSTLNHMLTSVSIRHNIHLFHPLHCDTF